MESEEPEKKPIVVTKLGSRFNAGLMKKIQKKSVEMEQAEKLIKIESQHETIRFRSQMHDIMKEEGVNVNHKNSGEILLQAALCGMINVIAYLESPQYNIHWQNDLGDGTLHFAARGN